MKSNEARSGKINSVETAFDIVEQLRKSDEAGVSELADSVGKSKSTVHAYLSTLEDLEYVINRDGQYSLSLRFLDYGIYARNRYDLITAARAPMNQVADRTGEVVWLFVEEYGHAVYVDRATGSHAVPIRGRIGKRSHLHCIAGGKALLAHMPRDRIERIVAEQGLPKYTPETTTDPQVLKEELETIREEGVAFNEGESMTGTRAVGAPIVVNDDLAGAISIAGPKNRLKSEEFRSELPDLILGVANEIELKLQIENRN